MQIMFALDSRLGFRPVAGALVEYHTCPANLVVRDKPSEPSLAFGNIAVAAAAYGIGIVVRDRLTLFTGIESEYTLCVALQGFVTEAHGLIVRCGGIFGFAYLYYSTSAIPAVRRIKFFPERVGRRQRHAVERGVFRAYLVIALRAILEIVSVAVAHERLPFAGHFSGRGHEIIFSAEVIGIICAVDMLNVIQKPFKRLSIAVLIKQRRKCLVQLMKRLHTGEYIVGSCEPPAHSLRHTDFLESRVKSRSVGADKLLHGRVSDNLDTELRPFLLEKRTHHPFEK